MNSPCGSCGALPLRLDAETAADDRGIAARDLSDLGVGPDVERALGLARSRVACALWRQAVGVLGGIETAFRAGEIAHDIHERVLGNRGIEVLAGGLGRFEIREHQLRLVVEHLLEMRNAPLRVHGIAVKAAADMIAHPAERHRAQRVRRHAQRRLAEVAPGRAARVLAQEKQQLRRPRKLRRIAESAVALVEGLLIAVERDIERICTGELPIRHDHDCRCR